MKIALLADTHFGIRGDAPYFLDYQERYFDEQFFPALKKLGITKIIHLGDLFDKRKSINSNTFKRAKKFFLDRIPEVGDMIIIAGNHDTYTDATNRINSLEMVVPEDSPISYTIDPIEYNEYGLLVVPWITRENYHKTMDMIENTKMDVVFGHLTIQGFEMHKGFPSAHGLTPALFERFALVCSGHFHHKSTQGCINYLGAPYEMTWSDFDCRRGFHVFDTRSKSLQFIPNKDTIFEKVEYNDGLVGYVDVYNKIVKLHVIMKNDPADFDDQLKKLNNKAHKVDVISRFEYKDVISQPETNVGKDTITLINQSIDRIDISANTAKVKTYMKDLHSRALELRNNVE